MVEGCDLLITCATVLTRDDADRILEDGAVAIRDQRIFAVGRTAEVVAAFRRSSWTAAALSIGASSAH